MDAGQQLMKWGLTISGLGGAAVVTGVITGDPPLTFGGLIVARFGLVVGAFGFALWVGGLVESNKG